jgi:hypothetical protein
LFLTNATRCWKLSVSLYSFKSRTPFPFYWYYTRIDLVRRWSVSVASLEYTATRRSAEYYQPSNEAVGTWTRLVNVLRMVARLDQFDDRHGNRRQGYRGTIRHQTRETGDEYTYPASPHTFPTPQSIRQILTLRHATRRSGNLPSYTPPQAGYDVLGHPFQGYPNHL